MRVLIVDDEPLARENLRLLLARHADVEAVLACTGGHEVAARARAFRPDVALLDVAMPDLDGFQVAATLAPHAPLLIFVTAYDEHAVRAFGADALDYLLKPFDDARFDAMLDRVRRRLAERRAAGGPAPYVDRLVVREVGRVRIVRVDDIDWIEADGVYACLHHGTASTLMRTTMAELDRSLDPRRFVRVHRSAIVRRDRVAGLRPARHGDYVVVLSDGRELPLSRRRRRAVARLLEG